MSTPPSLSVPPVAALLDLSGRVVLVTGAGTGIGAGIARRLAEAGARVMVHYHQSATGAHEVVAQIQSGGGTAASYAADLTDPQSVERLVRATVETLGGL